MSNLVMYYNYSYLYLQSELFTLGSRPGMECMPLRSPPGPYHYHVTDQTKSLQVCQIKYFYLFFIVKALSSSTCHTLAVNFMFLLCYSYKMIKLPWVRVIITGNHRAWTRSHILISKSCFDLKTFLTRRFKKRCILFSL